MKKVFKWVAIVLAILLVAGLICGFAFNFDKVKNGFNKVKNDVEDTINDYLTGGETDPTEDNNDESSIGAVTMSLTRVAENDEQSKMINQKQEIWFEYDFFNKTYKNSEYFKVSNGNFTTASTVFGSDIKGKEVTTCLKIESSTTVSFTVAEFSKIYILSTATSIKFDGSTVEKNGVENTNGSVQLYYYTLTANSGKHVISKAQKGELYFIGVYDNNLYSEKGEQTYKSYYDLWLDVDPYFAEVSTDYELTWINPESEWARDNDIDDYVILKDIRDTGVYIYCLQNFSESILITATGEIYLGETTKEFTTHCRIECVGVPVDYWNGGDKYVDSFEEEFYFDGFVVENGTLPPSEIRGDIRCDFITGAGADYYPVYGVGFTADDWEASVFTLEHMVWRCDEDTVFDDLVNYYQSQGEIKANEYYKILTFNCIAYVYFDEGDDVGNGMSNSMGFEVNHDIYVRGSALLELV